MKVTSYGHCPGSVDVVRQVGIDPKQPTAIAARGCAIEVNHLPRRMHAGVCPPGTNDFDRFVRHRRNGVFDQRLDADTGLLPLPAIVSSTIVLDAERGAHIGSGWLSARQRIQQLLRLLLLTLVTLIKHLFQNAASTAGIAHIDVRARQIELGTHFRHCTSVV